MELLKAILFGIVEGITEWLPISSTGHLILLDKLVELKVSKEFYEMFQVVIQLGAIGAVVVLFFHKLNPFSPKKTEKQKVMQMPDSEIKGKLLNIMRFGKFGKALAYEVNTADHDAPLTYSRLIDFEANYSKFMMKYDTISGRYYSVATRVYDPEKVRARHLLSLMSSKDLDHWDVVCDLHDYRDHDMAKVGFQYVDFEIEGDDIIYLQYIMTVIFNDSTLYILYQNIQFIF